MIPVVVADVELAEVVASSAINKTACNLQQLLVQNY